MIARASIIGAIRERYEPVIGLEVHVQLSTASKIFCACATLYGAPPNTQVCPVCLGYPGTLPVLNERAVELAARAALALGCEVHPRSIFARKRYFYPDLPKGYQISQYDRPLATGGGLEEGSLRCDANVSLRRRGEARLGTKTGVKNVNSFRYVEAALAFEIGRQAEILEREAPA
jgi:aspartyl-tRNA(Asn)/glutamyl-tRNA(Gln) amidotransferase subunit B